MTYCSMCFYAIVSSLVVAQDPAVPTDADVVSRTLEISVETWDNADVRPMAFRVSTEYGNWRADVGAGGIARVDIVMATDANAVISPLRAPATDTDIEGYLNSFLKQQRRYRIPQVHVVEADTNLTDETIRLPIFWNAGVTVSGVASRPDGTGDGVFVASPGSLLFATNDAGRFAVAGVPLAQSSVLALKDLSNGNVVVRDIDITESAGGTDLGNVGLPAAPSGQACSITINGLEHQVHRAPTTTEFWTIASPDGTVIVEAYAAYDGTLKLHPDVGGQPLLPAGDYYVIPGTVLAGGISLDALRAVLADVASQSNTRLQQVVEARITVRDGLNEENAFVLNAATLFNEWEYVTE